MTGATGGGKVLFSLQKRVFFLLLVVIVYLGGLVIETNCANHTQPLQNGWRQIDYKGSAPEARSYHTTVIDDKGRVFMFGGNLGIFTLEPQNDLHVYQTASSTWQKLAPWGSPPSPRFRHTAIFDPASRNMVVFGGATVTDLFDPPVFLNDVSHYHVEKNEWQSAVETTGTPPEPRVYHVAVVEDGVMIIFGGNGPSKIYNDVYKYHIAKRRWEKPEVSGDLPVARSHASAVLYEGKMILFGGLKWHGPEGYLNDVFSFDLGTNNWQEIKAPGYEPTRRVGHSAVVLQNFMYVFAGYEIEGLFVNDLYKLDLEKNIWTEIYEHENLPRKRFSHTALVAASSETSFLIFYGYSDELVLPAQNFDDVWQYSL